LAGDIEKVTRKDGSVSYRVRVELPPGPDGKCRQKTIAADAEERMRSA